MEAKDYWRLFLETGAPEMYLFYSRAQRMEAQDVPEDKGLSASRYGLQ